MSLKLKHFCFVKNGFKKVINSLSLQCRNLNILSASPPFFWSKIIRRKLCHNIVCICFWLITLVYSNNDRNLSSLCMVNSLNCLWHDTIICGNNQNNNVSNLSTTRAHHGECFMTWSIKECNVSTLSVNHVGTNFLSNTTGFTASNVGITNSIQSFCLTMINVTHYSNDRWTNHLAFFSSLIAFNNSLIIKTYKLNLTIVFRGKNCSCVRVN